MAILDLISPAYVLDRNYHFLDWNPAFDELIAKHMGLLRFRHVEDFVLKLDNHRDVIERSQRVFSAEKFPLVDIEDLVYVSPEFGRITFKKIASQIPDSDGNLLAWSINLNITQVDSEHEEALWAALDKRLNQEVNWSIYAKLYDRMLHQFDDYQALVKKMVELIGDAKDVVDLGAGTGNVSLEMLKQSRERTVLAVESNEEMLAQLRDKFRGGRRDELSRLRIFKGDIIESLREIDENTFDGVMLLNVLYAMPDRARCLREVYRILRPGGVVVYSTSTSKTDIDRLFDTIRDNMTEKKLIDDMRPIIDLAYDRHLAMQENILRDSEDDVVNYARRAGFDVEGDDILHSQYAGAVSIVKATKPLFTPEVELEPLVKTDPTLEKLSVVQQAEAQITGTASDKPSMLFISYAREDMVWCQRILKYLQPAVDGGKLRIWVDEHIKLGEVWEPELEARLNESSLALLLVTPSFLVSDYIKSKELPWLLHRRALGKLHAIPVLIEPCLVDAYAYPYLDAEGNEQSIYLNELLFARAGDRSVAELDRSQQNVFIDKLARRILSRSGQMAIN